MLAIAVASGRVGYVFLAGGTVCSWQLSRNAARSPEDAARYLKDWIDRLRPDTVVTEKITDRCRKGEAARANIDAIARIAADEDVSDIAVPRERQYPNKYAEAEALTDRFPELKSRLPKARKPWDSEPRNTTIFEALTFALAVIDREPDVQQSPGQ